MKCKKKVEIKNPQSVILENMTPALRGLCPVSGTVVYRFVKRHPDPVFALIMAIESEKKSARQYLKAAVITEDAGGRQIYRWLANRARISVSDLEWQLKSLQDNGIWLNLEDKTPELVRSEFPERSSGAAGARESYACRIKALHMAVTVDRQAIAFYRKTEKAATDQEV